MKDKHLYENVVVIDRTSKYGNPFRRIDYGSKDEVLKLYEEYLLTNKELCDMVYSELKNKTLACWCKPSKCHGDIIVDYINKRDIEDMFG